MKFGPYSHTEGIFLRSPDETGRLVHWRIGSREVDTRGRSRCHYFRKAVRA